MRQEASPLQPGHFEFAGAADALVAITSDAATQALVRQSIHQSSEHARAAHAAALRLRHAVARRRWKADLVVVVTWHNRSIDWLADAFPLKHTSFVLYSKGGLKRCDADVPATVAPAVVACHEVHNAGGREAQTIAQFIVMHYRILPRLTYFVQDDERFDKTVALRGINDTAAFEAWATLAETRPFSGIQACLCTIVVETKWTLKGYGPELYEPMRWFMENFLGFDVTASNWTSVRWPGNADLVVPASAIRSRPVELYMLILLIFNGTSPANHDVIAQDTTLILQPPVLPARPNLRGMLPMAHVLERLWFAVFDTQYSPYQADYDARPAVAQPAQHERAS